MKNAWKIIVIAILILVSIAGAGAATYWYTQYQKVVTNPQAGSADEVKALVKKLSIFMELPEESPSVITITDREKLQNQEFFKKAKNGDKIIVYEKARRIILYRPSNSRIIDVAPLVFNTETNASEQLNDQFITQQIQPEISPTISPNPESTSSASSTATPSTTPNYE
jgi:hypothetical protein